MQGKEGYRGLLTPHFDRQAAGKSGRYGGKEPKVLINYTAEKQIQVVICSIGVISFVTTYLQQATKSQILGVDPKFGHQPDSNS